MTLVYEGYLTSHSSSQLSRVARPGPGATDEGPLMLQLTVAVP